MHKNDDSSSTSSGKHAEQYCENESKPITQSQKKNWLTLRKQKNIGQHTL